MSKVLKFIVHFIVICTIVCVVGLAVPPFLGITTEIMDDSSKDTNLPHGIRYLCNSGENRKRCCRRLYPVSGRISAYKYMITEMDQENHIFKVIDKTDASGETISVEVKDYIPKAVITVGYVGYLLIATESIEGLIILGLAVLFLIILISLP